MAAYCVYACSLRRCACRLPLWRTAMSSWSAVGPIRTTSLPHRPAQHFGSGHLPWGCTFALRKRLQYHPRTRSGLAGHRPSGPNDCRCLNPVTTLHSSQVNEGSNGAYGGDFYWSGGSSNISPNENSASLGPFNSSYFGFLLVCGKSSCPGAPQGEIDVKEVALVVHETSWAPPFRHRPACGKHQVGSEGRGARSPQPTRHQACARCRSA